MKDVENGRTHEPSLRELTSQIDGMVNLYEERDRRYEDRFKAQEAAVAMALAAAEKLTAAAFAASKEAILKAENSQTAYNASHNDLTRKMDAQYKEMLPRPEADGRFKSVEEKLDDTKKELQGLRESRSEGSGRQSQQVEGRAGNQWAISAAIAFASVLVAVVVLGSGMFNRQPLAPAPATPPVVIYQSPPPAPNTVTDSRPPKGVAP